MIFLSLYFFLVGSSTFSFSHFFVLLLGFAFQFTVHHTLNWCQRHKNPKENENASQKKKTSIIPKSFLTTGSRIIFNTSDWKNIKQDCAIIVGPPLLMLYQYVCNFMLHLAKEKSIPEMVRYYSICFNPSWSYIKFSTL